MTVSSLWNMFATYLDPVSIDRAMYGTCKASQASFSYPMWFKGLAGPEKMGPEDHVNYLILASIRGDPLQQHRWMSTFKMDWSLSPEHSTRLINILHKMYTTPSITDDQLLDMLRGDITERTVLTNHRVFFHGLLQSTLSTHRYNLLRRVLDMISVPTYSLMTNLFERSIRSADIQIIEVVYHSTQCHVDRSSIHWWAWHAARLITDPTKYLRVYEWLTQHLSKDRDGVPIRCHRTCKCQQMAQHKMIKSKHAINKKRIKFNHSILKVSKRVPNSSSASASVTPSC